MLLEVIAQIEVLHIPVAASCVSSALLAAIQVLRSDANFNQIAVVIWLGELRRLWLSVDNLRNSAAVCDSFE